MHITLHGATETVREMLDQIDPETGELPEGYDHARAILASKATAVAAYIVESDLQTDMVEEYAKDLLARVKTERARGGWWRRHLSEHMAAGGITEIKDERGIFKATLAVGRDEAVEVFDDAQVPAEYIRTVTKTEPDKAAIKAAIKAGAEVAGAKLVKRDRLTVR
jgi:hypothetical protein